MAQEDSEYVTYGYYNETVGRAPSFTAPASEARQIWERLSHPLRESYWIRPATGSEVAKRQARDRDFLNKWPARNPEEEEGSANGE